jgi:hypothetical protein
MHGEIEGIVGIVPDPVTNGIIQTHGHIHGIRRTDCLLLDKRPDVRMVAVDDIRGSEVLIKILHGILQRSRLL